MKRPKRDRVREERIPNEIIVDANGPEEQVMGWYYVPVRPTHLPPLNREQQ